MLPGYNTDFKYRGETYHVQTEDNGTANPFVVTLLYFKGAILASKRTPYHELLGLPDQAKRLAELMKAQHKAIMRDLLAGAFDGTIAPAAQAVAAATLPDATPRTAATVGASSLFEPAADAAPAAAPKVAVASPAEPPPESLPLDAAIARYLREYAAAAAAGAAAHP